jgi:hypothetical protein
MIQNGCVATPMQNNCNQLDLFTKTLTLPLVTIACHTSLDNVWWLWKHHP